MAQNRDSGARANEFGRRMAATVAQNIGAQKFDNEGNEFTWNGKSITIRSAHRGNAYVGVLYSMLERVDSVLAALETDTPDEFQVWELDGTTYLHDATPQVKNPLIAQMSIKTFPKKGKLIAKVMDTK